MHKRWFGVVPLFDPKEGITVLEPPGHGPGYWVGAPSALYDDADRTFYLYYRLRTPRGEGRGYECRIARSEDGVRFGDIWAARKEKFGSESVERAALVKTPEGRYRLYIGFVDPKDGRWRIDAMDAMRPDAFDPRSRTPTLTAADIGGEGVKDPYVLIAGRMYYMIASYAPRPARVSPEARDRMHATADVYNTGIVKSHSGLALSGDGVYFRWIGDVFSPTEEGWDAYAARLGCVVYLPPVFTAFYDGGASVEDNYEEKTGLAISFDLRTYDRVSVDGPILTSPHASGSLRYLDALVLDGKIRYYYEYARPDGSHELRTSEACLD